MDKIRKCVTKAEIKRFNIALFLSSSTYELR